MLKSWLIKRLNRVTNTRLSSTMDETAWGLRSAFNSCVCVERTMKRTCSDVDALALREVLEVGYKNSVESGLFS